MIIGNNNNNQAILQKQNVKKTNKNQIENKTIIENININKTIIPTNNIEVQQESYLVKDFVPKETLEKQKKVELKKESSKKLNEQLKLDIITKININENKILEKQPDLNDKPLKQYKMTPAKH